MRLFRRGDKQVIDHVEALLALRVVGACNVDDRHELALRIGLEEGEHVDDVGCINHDRQFAIGQRGATGTRAELVGEIGGKIGKRFGSFSPHRSIVPVRRIFFCRSRMP